MILFIEDLTEQSPASSVLCGTCYTKRYNDALCCCRFTSRSTPCVQPAHAEVKGLHVEAFVPWVRVCVSDPGPAKTAKFWVCLPKSRALVTKISRKGLCLKFA